MNEDRFAYVRSKRQRGKIWDIYEKDFRLILNLDLKCMIQILILIESGVYILNINLCVANSWNFRNISQRLADKRAIEFFPGQGNVG